MTLTNYLISCARVMRSKTIKSRGSLVVTLTKLFFLRNFGNSKSSASISYDGMRLNAFESSNLEFLIGEIFVHETYFFRAKSDRPLIIDCGANIGMSVLYFKHLYPNAVIHAFEPQERAFEILNKNIKDNNFKDVFTYNCALSKKEGTIDFFEHTSGVGLMASIYEARETHGTKKTVKAITLSGKLKTLPTPDLIKIDVEGAELEIIEDLADNNELKADQVVMEYHNNIDGRDLSPIPVLSRFEKAGYRYSFEANYKNAGDFQDVLIHFIKNK